MQERRTHTRYDVSAQIRVRSGRVSYIMDVMNVSLAGMFIATGGCKNLAGLEFGQHVEGDLFLPDVADDIHVSGRIIRIVDSGERHRRGYGIEFTSLAEHERAKLGRLLDRAGPRQP